MIIGTHILFYSTDPDADRAFLRDMLGLRFVDAGEGWPIFAMPPAEAAIHPSDGGFSQAHAGRAMMGAIVYLMCDDLPAFIRSLTAKGVAFSPVEHAPWGESTSFPLPSGAHIGVYQPAHPTALGLGA